MPSLTHKRGSRVQIDAAALLNQIKVGEVYLITDEGRLTVGTAINAHTPVAKQSEAGGGGGAPGGVATSIQFNNGGAFAGDADFAWDATNNDLILGGVDTGIIQRGITNEPANPPADMLAYYSKKIAGRMFPKVKGPFGLDYSLQESLWSNAVYLWTPTTSTNGNWLGTTGIGSGTFSTALPSTTSTSQSIRRTRWANVVTTLNQVLGQRGTELLFFRGNAINRGAFFFAARCSLDTWTNGGRFFGGMHNSTNVVAADPSTTNNSIGFCIDAADNGAISFMTRGTAGVTKAATGFTGVSGKGYDLYINCFANDTNVFWRIVDIDTQIEASGVATLNLPANTIMMSAGVLASNAALTAVGAVQVACSRIYVGTDF